MYISIQTLSTPSSPPAQLPLLIYLISKFQLKSSAAHNTNLFRLHFTFLTWKAGMFVWLTLFVFLFSRTKGFYCSLHNAWKQLNHIFCPVSSMWKAAGWVKYQFLCSGWKEKARNYFLVDTNYQEKRFWPYSKAQTFTIIILGACHCSLQHLFLTKVLLFHGVCYTVTKKWPNIFCHNQNFLQTPFFVSGHIQEWQSLSSPVKGLDQDAI